MRWLLVTLAFSAAFAQYEQPIEEPGEGLSKSEKVFGEANEGKAQEHIEEELAGPPEYVRGGNSPGGSGEDPYSSYGRAPPAPSDAAIPASEPLPPAPASAPGSSEKETGPAAPEEKIPEVVPVEKTSEEAPAQQDKAYPAPVEEKPSVAPEAPAEQTTASPADKSYKASPSGDTTEAPVGSEAGTVAAGETTEAPTVTETATEATEGATEAQETTQAASAEEKPEETSPEQKPEEAAAPSDGSKPSPSTLAEYAGPKKASGEAIVTEETTVSVPEETPAVVAESGETTASVPETTVASDSENIETTVSVPEETPAGSIAPSGSYDNGPKSEDTVTPAAPVAEEATVSVPEEIPVGSVASSEEATAAEVTTTVSAPSESRGETTVASDSENIETTVSVPEETPGAPSVSGSYENGSAPKTEETVTPSVTETTTDVYVTSPIPKSSEGPALGEQASVSEDKPKDEGYAASSVQPSSVVPEAAPLPDKETPVSSSQSGSYQSPTGVTVAETETTTVAEETTEASKQKVETTSVSSQEAQFSEEQAPETPAAVQETTVAPAPEAVPSSETSGSSAETTAASAGTNASKEEAYAAEKSAERTISPVEVASEGSASSAETVAPSTPTSSKTEEPGYEEGSGLSPPFNDQKATEAPVTVAAPGAPTSAEIEAASLPHILRNQLKAAEKVVDYQVVEDGSKVNKSSESTEQPTAATEGSGYASSEAPKSAESHESSSEAPTAEGYAEKAPGKPSSAESTEGSGLPTETAAEIASTEKTEYQQPEKAEGEKSQETVTDIKAGSGNGDEKHLEGRSVPQEDSLDPQELEEFDEDINPSTPKPARAPKIDGDVTPSKLMRKLIRMRATRPPLSSTTLESIILHEIDEMTRRRALLGKLRQGTTEDEDEEVDKPVLKIQKIGERQGVIVDVVTREPVIIVDGREDTGEDTSKEKREEEIVGIAKVEPLSVPKKSKRRKLTTNPESTTLSSESLSDSESIERSEETTRLTKRKLPASKTLDLKTGLVQTEPLEEESIDYETERENQETTTTIKKNRRQKLTTTMAPKTELSPVVKGKRRKLTTTVAPETDLASLDTESTVTASSPEERVTTTSDAENDLSSLEPVAPKIVKEKRRKLTTTVPPETDLFSLETASTETDTVLDNEPDTELTTVVKGKRQKLTTTMPPETDLFSLDTESTETETTSSSRQRVNLVPKRTDTTLLLVGPPEEVIVDHQTEAIAPETTTLISTTIEHLTREEKLAAGLDSSNILKELDKSLKDSNLQEISLTESENSTETVEGRRGTVALTETKNLTEAEPNLRTKKVKRIHKIKRVRVVHRNRSTTTVSVPEFRDLPTYSEAKPVEEEKVIVPKTETTTLWAYATAPGERTLPPGETLAPEGSRTESTETTTVAETETETTVTSTTVLTLEFSHDTTNSNMQLEPSGYEMGHEPTVITPDLPPTKPEEAVGYDGIPKEEKDSKRELPDQKEISLNSGEVKLQSQGSWMPYRFDCSKEIDDKGSLCKEWAQAGLCEQNRPTAFLFCRKTCLCVGPWARRR